MTTEIKDSIFRKFEEYVLSGKKVEDTLKNLVEGSNYYNYLKSLDLLTKKKLNLTSEEKDFIDGYIARSKTSESEKIKLRLNLLNYDAAKTEDDKANALETIAEKDLKLQFSHQRPADLGMKRNEEMSGESSGEEEEGSKKKPQKKQTKKADEIVMNEVDPKEEIAKLYRREIRPHELNRKILAKLDFTKLPKDTIEQVMEALGNDLMMVTDPSLLKVYAKYVNENYAISRSFSIRSSILSMMTIDQMNTLKELIPNIDGCGDFLKSYISKYFSKELSAEYNSQLSEEERRVNLLKIYEMAKNLPFVLSGFKTNVLYEILENGIRLDIYSKPHFMEYLKYPMRCNGFKSNISYGGSDWDYLLKNVKSKRQLFTSGAYYDRDMKVLEAYIGHFIKTGEKMENITNYIDENVFISIRDAAMLTSGQKVEITPYNSAQLEKLGREVSIEISPNNKEVFNLNEDINILVELKNIPTLFIKVFEVNTENYYRKNMVPFKTDINLDGLVASIEKSIEFKERPQVKFKEALKFPELKSKSGLFVIELIGNGKSSRAVIKVGTLSFISSPKVFGQECYILDGDRKKCSGESTGIFMDNQLYKADIKHKGKIIIPYLPNGGSRTSKAILMHNGMAQLVDFTRMEEIYSLNCGFCMFPESYIMGKKATILIRPRLFVNGRRANLSLLENITCVVCSSSYVDDIPVSESYKNLKIQENQELAVAFQAVAQIKSLNITFTAEVKSESKNKTETLTASHSFVIDNHASDKSITELYLRMNKDNYEIHVLGKNGEPIPNAPLEFRFSSNLFQYVIPKSAVTNESGIIKLGKLIGVKSFRADMLQVLNSQTISKEWIVPQKTIYDYPSSIDIIEGEAISLPIPYSNIEDPIYLQGVSQEGEVLSNTSKLVEINANKGMLYGEIKIEKLQAGNYILWGFYEDLHISICVHKGVYWIENPNYIQTKFSLIEKISHDLNSTIKIKKVHFSTEESKESKNNLRMAIDVAPSSSTNWRLHVLLFQYLPGNINEIISRLKSEEQQRLNESYFQVWSNFYLSNRELSTEFRYCFDRKQMARFTGNTLEKPRLLLKRALVQATETQVGFMKEGTAYNAKMEEEASAKMRCAEMAMKSRACYDRMSPSIGARASVDLISLFQNFISREPKVLYNIPGNKENAIVIELEKELLEIYGGMLVLAIDEFSAVHYLQSLDGIKVEKRDITLQKPLSTEKMYSEMRTAKCVEKYQSHIIDDITSKDRLVVDSLEKILMVEKEIMKLRGVAIPDLEKFGDTILKWSTYSEDEKNKQLSKYSCHELHLFILKKDQPYFEKIVKPYLINKMEKTFMDYYFLNDLPAMLTYLEKPYKFAQFNALEKALFVEALTLNNQKELAEKIAKSMREDVNSIKKIVSEQNRVFDTVLNLNMLKPTREGADGQNFDGRVPSYLPPGAPMISAEARPQGRVARKMQRKASESYNVGNEDDNLSENEMMDKGNAYEEKEKEKQRDLSDSGGSSDEEKPSAYRAMGNMKMEKKKKKKPAGRSQAPKQAAPEDIREAKEYAECNYYNNASGHYFKYQVTDSEFWAAYAEHVLKFGLTKSFLSCGFIDTFNTLTEIIASLALLDLPYTALEHGFKTLEGRAAELKATTNLMIFQKEVKECPGDIQSNILVAQRYLDPMLSREEGDEKIEEFLINKVYMTEVIVTNISSRKLEFNVLWQIPEGSVPVGNSTYQKSESLTLNSYSTIKKEYYFYFPSPGKFEHFPPNISVNSRVVAKAAKSILTVVKQKSKISETNFREVLSTLDKNLILNFLKDNPIKTIKEFNWNSIYWLLSDKTFFKGFIELLRQQKRFDEVTWSYSLYHKEDEKAIIEYLDSISYYHSRIGYSFISKLIKVDPINSSLRHLDYYPLVNPRAHKIEIIMDNTGAERPLILNYNFYEQYKKFIFYMIEKEAWDVQDKMTLAYYLLLQERVQDGLKIYGTIKPEVELKGDGPLRLQYDYMTTFLDFYTGAPEFKKARSIVQKYINYPIISWRFLFMDVQTQLQEYDGKSASEMTMIQTTKKEDDVEKKAVVITQPKLGLVLEGKSLVIDYQNLQELTLKYYVIDLEILFCRSPFLAQNTEDFSYVLPNMVESIKLDPKSCEFRVKIPDKYVTKNIVIEANGGGIQSLVTYFSTSLKVNIFENYGELKVTDETGKGLPQVYVKICAKMKNNSTTFYKDGYTDIRGRFDYVSHNASKLSEVQKFAIFISSETFGSLIRETVPPPIVTKSEEDFGYANNRFAGYMKKMDCDKQSYSKK